VTVTALIHDNHALPSATYPFRDSVVRAGVHEHAMKKHDWLRAGIAPFAIPKPQPIKHHELIAHQRILPDPAQRVECRSAGMMLVVLGAVW
jgi:hypothetical protein